MKKTAFSRSLNRKLKKFNCIFYDFDGVMTDNSVTVSADGMESVVCHRGDGWAVRRFKEYGLKQFILTTETNQVVKLRAKKLGIPCLVAKDDKKKFLSAFTKLHKINLQHCVYFGNDQNDAEAMAMVGFKVAPADAINSIKIKADIVTIAVGGRGVVREFLDYYEKVRGRGGC